MSDLIIYNTPDGKSSIALYAKVFTSTHTHIKGFSPYITATDICQAKLYGELTVNCNKFQVVSEKYLSEYDTRTDSLIITFRLRK